MVITRSKILANEAEGCVGNPLPEAFHGRDFLAINPFYAIPFHAFCALSVVRAMLRTRYQQDQPAMNSG